MLINGSTNNSFNFKTRLNEHHTKDYPYATVPSTELCITVINKFKLHYTYEFMFLILTELLLQVHTFVAIFTAAANHFARSFMQDTHDVMFI